MFRKVRTLVSQDKFRYRDGEFDLDLTYICRRVIAMGFPAAGLEALFRNDRNMTASWAQKHHEGHFMIVNVSERDYSRSIFGRHRVLDAPFPDHFNPPLELLFRIVYELHAYLSEDPRNVVIVHCLAGRGRTGTVISAYLYFLGIFSAAGEAMDFFALRRSLTHQGVTKPSQRRYVRYFTGVLATGRAIRRARVRLRRLVFSGVPTFQGKSEAQAGCRPVVNVYSAHTHPPTLLFSTLWWTQTHVPSYRVQDGFISFDLDGVVVAGDFIIRAYHMPPRAKVVEDSNEMFRVSLHTDFIDSVVLVLPRSELDGAHSHHEGRFPDSFSLSLIVDLAPDDGRVHTAPYTHVHATRIREAQLPPVQEHWAVLRETHLSILAVRASQATPIPGSWRDGWDMPPKPPDVLAAVAAATAAAVPGTVHEPTETERVLSNGGKLQEYGHVLATSPERAAHRPPELRLSFAGAGGLPSPFGVPLTSYGVHSFATLHAWTNGQIESLQWPQQPTAATAAAAAPFAASASSAGAAGGSGDIPIAAPGAGASGSGSAAAGSPASEASRSPVVGGLAVPMAKTLLTREARTVTVARKSRMDLSHSTAYELPDSVDAAAAAEVANSKRFSRMPGTGAGVTPAAAAAAVASGSSGGSANSGNSTGPSDMPRAARAAESID